MPSTDVTEQTAHASGEPKLAKIPKWSFFKSVGEANIPIINNMTDCKIININDITRAS